MGATDELREQQDRYYDSKSHSVPGFRVDAVDLGFERGGHRCLGGRHSIMSFPSRCENHRGDSKDDGTSRAVLCENASQFHL